MAKKDVTNKTPAPAGNGDQLGLPGAERWVRVRIRKAIAMGGLVFRPKVDGEKIIPVEAVMLADDAARHGEDYVEVLDKNAEAPADGVPTIISVE